VRAGADGVAAEAGVGEFDLIRRHLQRVGADRADVLLGVGDDAALVRPGAGMELALCVDTLVEGVHFHPGVAAADLGHKALAVNLSDLAAMGAEPAWATLALTLPDADEAWVAEFAAGFSALANSLGLALVGGDTCRGARAVSVQLAGQVPSGQALRRRGARPGDWVVVSGTLGDAAIALSHCLDPQGRVLSPSGDAEARQWLLTRLHRPTPRLALGAALRGVASACIDISDGLLADLGHLLAQSGVGVSIDLARLPLSAQALAVAGEVATRAAACAGGDDYELCFTVPEACMVELTTRNARCGGGGLTVIGRIESESGLRLRDAHGRCVTPPATGYQHFAR
jgi:thiamine-monophosphate kinase